MNHTTKRFPRSTSEAFPDERYQYMTHFTDDKYLFKDRGQSWWIIVLACLAFAFYEVFYG